MISLNSVDRRIELVVSGHLWQVEDLIAACNSGWLMKGQIMAKCRINMTMDQLVQHDSIINQTSSPENEVSGALSAHDKEALGERYQI